MLGLLLTSFAIVSLSAETWDQFIKRVETMEYNFRSGLNKGNQNTWGTDKWGALLATSYWLESAYEDIYKNAPGLTQEQKQIYQRLWNRHITQSDDLVKLCKLTYSDYNSAATINKRWEYWEDYLDNGGIITFN